MRNRNPELNGNTNRPSRKDKSSRTFCQAQSRSCQQVSILSTKKEMRKKKRKTHNRRHTTIGHRDGEIQEVNSIMADRAE